MTATMIVLVLFDIQHVVHMKTMEACFDGAKDFLSHDMSDALREKGAIGLSAACAYKEMPSERP